MSHPASQHSHESRDSHDLNSQLAFAGPRLNPSQFLAKDENFSRSQLTSILVHCAVVTIILIPLFARVLPPPHSPAPHTVDLYVPKITDYRPHTTASLDPSRGGGSGGAQDPLPLTKGMLPRFSPNQIVAPTINQNPNAALQVEPTLLATKSFEIPQEFAPNWGDPNAKDFNNSRGPGDGPGMGNHHGNGIGDGPGGDGYGPGNDGLGIQTPGQKGVSYPTCAYCPRPDYSDEARRAKYQGTVILNLVVLPDGRATSIEVLNSPGLGLDQKALEAVRTWRFTPAHDASGKPVAARIAIEVVFQLF